MQRNLSSCWILRRLYCKTLYNELDQGDNTSESRVMAAFVLAGRGTLFGSVRQQHSCGIRLPRCVRVVG